MRKFNKLIRDNIPDKINSEHNKCKTEICSDYELEQYRYNKVKEEIQELITSIDYQDVYCAEDIKEELIDVIEILWYFMYAKAITKEEWDNLFNNLLYKRMYCGAFDKNIILKEIISNDEE